MNATADAHKRADEILLMNAQLCLAGGVLPTTSHHVPPSEQWLALL